MRPLLLLAPLSFSLACLFGGKSQDDDTDRASTCDWEVTSLTPADGADGVWISQAFDRLVVETDATIDTLYLRDEDGEEREGDVEYDGTSAEWFVTNGSLFGDHTYEIVVEADDCEATVGAFTTGPWLQFEFPSDTVYALDLTNAEGSTFFRLFAEQGMELGFWSPEFAEWTLVPLTDGEQEPCVPTTDLQAGYAGSEIGLYHIDAPFGGEGLEFHLVDAEVNALASDASGWDRARFHGKLDLTPFAEALDEEDPCELIESLGEECAPCDDGSGNDCLVFDITGATAVARTGVDPSVSSGDCE